MVHHFNLITVVYTIGMTASPSPARRILLASGLFVGFYIIVGIFVGALLAVPIWIFVRRGYIEPYSMVFVLFALAILRALFARRLPSEPLPGIPITVDEAPGLFQLLGAVARQMDQPFPSEVRLLNEANAFVSYDVRGLGIRRQRIIGIGLPLVDALSRTELSAVVAHELAHYAARHDVVGPWNYLTQRAIGGTLRELGTSPLQFSLLWYERLVHRLHASASRESELVADAMAARIYGIEAMTAAVRRSETLRDAHFWYFNVTIRHLTRSGVVPLLVEGFRTHLRNTATDSEAWAIILGQAQTEILDSHPSLSERLNALSDAASGETVAPEAPTASMLVDSERWARRLLEHELGMDNVEHLREIRWSEVAEQVHLPEWRRIATQFEPALGALTIGSVPTDREGLLSLARTMGDWDRSGDAESLAIGRACDRLVASVKAVLVEHGWRVTYEPGLAVELINESGEKFDPLDWLSGFAEASRADQEWRAVLKRFDIGGLPLRLSAQRPSLL